MKTKEELIAELTELTKLYLYNGICFRLFTNRTITWKGKEYNYIYCSGICDGNTGEQDKGKLFIQLEKWGEPWDNSQPLAEELTTEQLQGILDDTNWINNK